MSRFVVTDLGEPILVVAPHPDDETLGCGGLIALAMKVGIKVHTLFVTDGSASHPASKKYTPDLMADIRAAEAQEALRRLGAKNQPSSFLKLRDGRMPVPGQNEYADVVDFVSDLVSVSKFKTVIVPWRRDPHTDHRICWQIATDAVRRSGRQTTFLEYQIWLEESGRPEDWPGEAEVDDATLDISEVVDIKLHALAAHRSQMGMVVDDDPSGFVLSSKTIARLVVDTESYWVSRWPVA
ncbi:PIG-L deacetylase family protein [Pararhizobium haloflavum]|uniref:PIG-L deacetylase family protein n=1 Tax=Pararhizobium haloflavum TaxID=2037914 RepID=UPI000C17DD83|nr:PIG-L deacetylase family protein [Pararhizobium haloflavum]